MMKPVRYLVSASLIVVATLFSGCVKLWQDNLDIRTYMLEVKREAVAANEPSAGKLWVDSVTVLPPFNVRSLVLRKSDVEFATSYYSELLMSPSENFRNIFYGWFADCGLFSEVSIVGRSGMSHSLSVTVMEFYGDVQHNEAVLSIKVSLLDEKTKGVRVLLSNDYMEKVSVTENSAEELIRAFNKGAVNILEDCEKDIAAVLSK